MNKTINAPIFLMFVFMILGIVFCYLGTFSVYHEMGHVSYAIEKGWNAEITSPTTTILHRDPDEGFLFSWFLQEWSGAIGIGMACLILSALWYPLLSLIGVPLGYLHALVFYPLRSSDFGKIMDMHRMDPIGWWLMLTVSSCLIAWLLIGWVIQARVAYVWENK